MAQLTALKELAEKVEADNWRWSVRLDAGMPDEAYDAFNGSLDAAKALHEAVLPGWVWGICFNAHSELYAWVGDGEYETDECYSPNPARAWLMAILAAKIWQLTWEGET